MRSWCAAATPTASSARSTPTPPKHAGRARGLHRRRPRCAATAPLKSIVPFKSRDGSAMKKPARQALRDRQGPLRRRPDRVRGGGDRCCRPRTPPRRSRSTSSRCRRSPTPREAVQAGAPQLYDDAPGNVALDYHFGDTEKVDAGLRRGRARRQAHARQQPRVVVNAMEPRAAVGELRQGERTLHALHSAARA